MMDNNKPQAVEVNYEPDGPTLISFHESQAFVRGICGPFGSAKSTACTMEILRRAAEQMPAKNGQRKSRWAVVRNSYPELKTTTLKTWNQWVPAHYGRLTMDSPIRHYVNTRELELEVLFMALDRPEDVKKLLSLELTGAWLNEAREIPKAILDGITGRVGRYPSMADGGCTWSGVIMDTNPPDDQSWWYHFAEEECPEGFEFFKQPGGRDPKAENMKNLPPNYYQRMVAGKDPDWVKVYVDGQYGFVVEGKPVFPMFRDRTHVPLDFIQPVEGIPLLIGVDFGNTPAAIIGQKTPSGRWLVLDELCADGGGLIAFCGALTKFVAKQYPGFTVSGGWGDPAGLKKGEHDEKTCFEIMNAFTPWRWRPAPVPDNNLTVRLEAVAGLLNRLVDGDPALLISKRAKLFRKGMAGGYCYKLLMTGDGTQTHETPDKNKFSHPADAFQYLILGGGEHNVMMGKAVKRRQERGAVCAGLDYNPLDGIQGNPRKEKDPPWMARIRKY